MSNRKPSVAIIGAGMGGLAAAAILARKGFDIRVYEQAEQFSRIGAGIQMTPNAMKVLRAIGLEESLRDIAFRPPLQYSKQGDTGEINVQVPFGDYVEERYGTPFLLMHRGDLHALLTGAVPQEIIHRGKKLVGLNQDAHAVELSFADGTTASADMVIGADGVHSLVRDILFGAERPRYSGRVAYRSTFSTDLLNGREFDPCTKWWGADRHIVIYYITRQKDEMYFVTSLPEPDWTDESWSQKGDMEQLRAAFAGFHPDVRAFLDACPTSHKWAIVERDPLPEWSKGRVVLLGDACHPMTPYMAQGAATSMEDAAVLWRCLDGADHGALNPAFALYEATRKARTSKIQLVSHQNKWLHKSANTDWVFGYDAWNAPLGHFDEAQAS